MKPALSTVLIAAAIAAAAPAFAVTPEGDRPVRGVAPGDENCDVTVVFGSYAMGIDGKSFEKVEAYLKRRKAVKYAATNWGREGERTVCVDTRTKTQTRKVFTDIRNLLPRVSQRGPVELRSNLGQAYRTQSPYDRR